MLGSTQTDPIWILTITQQRHAELLADVRHDELVHAALQYCAARTVCQDNVSRGRLGRLAGHLSATLRLAAVSPTPARGA